MGSKKGKDIDGNLSCAPEDLASDRLTAFCAALAGNCSGASPQWRCHRSGDGWQATVDLNLGGVLHTLQGDVCHDIGTAREDTACRALWYLQCPGFESLFEASVEAVAAETLVLSPGSDWRREGGQRNIVSESQP